MRILSALVGAVIGAGLMSIYDNSQAPEDLSDSPVIVSGYKPDRTAYDYGAYDMSYTDVSFPCTDPIVLPNRQGFCKEDQEIGTLVEQLKRANVNFADPGQSMLFWRFSP